MTYPSVNTAGQTTTTTSSSGTTHTLTMPASIAAGDLLVAWFEASGITSTSTSIATNVGTWTKVFEVNPAASTQLGVLFWKWADGSEDGASVVITVGVAFARSIGSVFTISGAYSLNNPFFSANTTNTFDPPSVTAPWGTGENLFIAIAASAINGAVNFTGAPTGYSNLTSKTGANSGGIGQASKQSTSATDNPSAFTASGGAVYVSATMVVTGVPAQTVDTINGGSPFTASQVSSSAETSGFTGGGAMSSITAEWGAYSIPITNIGGTLDDPTFNKAVRVDGQVYPADGETLSLTFTKGAQSADATQVFNKDADEVEIIVASPVLDDNDYLFSAILDATGRSAVDGDKGYYVVPAEMSDLTIDPDGRVRTTNAGTFGIWMYTEATAVNYFYSIAVAAGGEVISVTKFIGSTIKGSFLAGSILKGKLL